MQALLKQRFDLKKNYGTTSFVRVALLTPSYYISLISNEKSQTSEKNNF